MRVRYLSLTNFRNYSRLELQMPDEPVLLHGANAQGKTSLLEAIYLLSTGASPVTSVDRQLIRWAATEEPLPYARVWAEVARRDRTYELEIVLETHPQADGSERLQKTLRVDRARRRRADLAGTLNVVLFTPGDVEIVAGSPSRRRRYLDDTLCQVDSEYARALARYTDVLRQRNAALRYLRERGGDQDQLSPFEDALARDGSLIALRRRDTVAELSERAGRVHAELTGGLEWLRLGYAPNFDPSAPPGRTYQPGLGLPAPFEARLQMDGKELTAAFRAALLRRRSDEIARAVTLVGPHRDELRFVSGSPAQGTHGIDLGTFGSRGQQRTAVLALKMAELAWVRDRTQESPVLLLDEVLAELDTARRRLVLTCVNGAEQALLTTTDLEMFTTEFRERAVLWRVTAGVIVTG